jgi:hypothetical protein
VRFSFSPKEERKRERGPQMNECLFIYLFSIVFFNVLVLIVDAKSCMFLKEGEYPVGLCRFAS